MTALIERRRSKRVLCLAISILALGLFADRPAFADGGGGDDAAGLFRRQTPCAVRGTVGKKHASTFVGQWAPVLA